MEISELRGKIKEGQKKMRSHWAITPSVFAEIQQLYSNFKEDPKAFLDIEIKQDADNILSFDNDTAIINISGPLVDQHDCMTIFFGCCSYEDISNAIAKAEEMSNIKKIIFDISSPGGMVDGCDNCSQAIKSAKKPTEARVGSMAASAAYWLASQCDTIVATSLTASFGSIGVVVEYWDGTRKMNDAGYDKITIVSAGAPDKRLDAMDDDDRKKIKDDLTDIESIFIRRIAEGRGVTPSDVYANFGQGRMIIAEKSLEKKMIDSIEMISQNTIENKINEESSEDEMEMTLDEFLAKNADAKKEFDKKMANAASEAVKSALEKADAENKRLVAATKKYFSSDYPEKIKEMASKTISGEMSEDALKAAVEYHDSTKQESESSAAQKETKAIGDTKPEGAENADKLASGIIEDDETYKASIARMKIN